MSRRRSLTTTCDACSMMSMGVFVFVRHVCMPHTMVGFFSAGLVTVQSNYSLGLSSAALDLGTYSPLKKGGCSMKAMPELLG